MVSSWNNDGVFVRGESPTHHTNQMNRLKDAAPLIALAAAPLVLVIAFATLMTFKVDTEVDRDGIANIILLHGNDRSSHAS